MFLNVAQHFTVRGKAVHIASVRVELGDLGKSGTELTQSSRQQLVPTAAEYNSPTEHWALTACWPRVEYGAPSDTLKCTTATIQPLQIKLCRDGLVDDVL